ncbi:MAG: WecB/TagA/CpsF family glycosyltransferase [Spirochaetaceae bacterium]|nr:WecB/TagA/CpsF family glycosyltransferase [Spirochaetaceae bacterium]
MAIKRIELLNVPIDILSPGNLEEVLLGLLERPGTKQIVFLNIWDLLKARRNSKFRECLVNADLVLPVSKSIIKGANKLQLAPPVRYNPFSTIISCLSILDSHYKSLYLFGGRKRALSKAEKNVHATFPNVRLVGRYVGNYSKDMERDIIAAMYKASPSFVLVSDGVSEKDCWAYNRRNKFSSSLFLYNKDIINIFAKRTKRISSSVFDKGMEIWIEILHNPLKIFLFLPYIWYNLLLLWCKLSKKNEQ